MPAGCRNKKAILLFRGIFFLLLGGGDAMTQAGEQYVVFTIDHSLYGIPIHEVSEIIRIQTVNWIPNSSEEWIGIIHLREKVIPVMSLHKVFSGTEKELDAKTRIIIVHIGGKEIGIVVDEVDQVMFLPQQQISPPPHWSQNGWMTGVYHQQDTMIALLHLESLLGNMEVHLPNE